MCLRAIRSFSGYLKTSTDKIPPPAYHIIQRVSNRITICVGFFCWIHTAFLHTIVFVASLLYVWGSFLEHYGDVIMGAIASLITSLSIVYSTVYSDADQRKHQKVRVTGLSAGNSPGAGEFPAQMASNAENFFHWMTSSWFERMSYPGLNKGMCCMYCTWNQNSAKY